MKRNSSKSQNKSSSRSIKRIDFKPNTTIYKKSTTSENIKNTIILDVGFRKPSDPTIEMKSFIRK